MLSPMRLDDERSFGADDPVARYWLHNCVGFRVRGVGVVHGIADSKHGAVLVVRRLGMTTRVSVERVESVDPWTETITLAGRRREPREGPHVATRAAGAVAVLTAVVLRSFFALLAGLLVAAAAFTRKHAPGARERAGAVAAGIAAVGHAYALEAARAYRAQTDAMKAWRDERRRSAWGDESAPTRAGAEETGARREDDRALPSKHVGP